MPHPTIKPVLLWTHRDTLTELPLVLTKLVPTRTCANSVPVVIVPLVSITMGDHFEGHAAEFLSDGIQVHVNVVAARNPPDADGPAPLSARLKK